jgi:hypothetical protein
MEFQDWMRHFQSVIVRKNTLRIHAQEPFITDPRDSLCVHTQSMHQRSSQ